MNLTIRNDLNLNLRNIRSLGVEHGISQPNI